MDLVGMRDGEDLGLVEGKKTIIRMYYVRGKKLLSVKGRNRNKSKNV